MILQILESTWIQAWLELQETVVMVVMITQTHLHIGLWPNKILHVDCAIYRIFVFTALLRS